MNRVSVSLALSAVVVGLAACADSATKTVEPSLQQPVLNQSPELNYNYKHIMKLKDEGKQDAEQAEKDAADEAKINSKPAGSGIYYHGGPLIVSPSVTKVVAIYWATGAIYDNGPVNSVGSGSADNTLIGSFLRNLGGSAYFNINTTYYNPNTGAHVINSVAYTSYWATGSSVAPPSSSPTDANMVALIGAGINGGKIAYDPNAVYLIFTGQGINLGGGFGSHYCAYHTNGTVNGQTVLYAAMPRNQNFPSACTPGAASPNSDVAANSEVNTLAHEIEETTTDPLGTAWWDRRGYENADKCAWTFGATYSVNGGTANMTFADGKSYLVQRNWVNSGSGACALSF